MSDEGDAIVCGVTPPGGKEIDRLPLRCPICRARIASGYGLMGGGCGTYWYCESEGECPWFAKRQELEDGELGPLMEWRS